MNGKFYSAIASIVLGFVCEASAAPVVENWSRSIHSYDLHAVAKDRFRIEDTTSDGPKIAKFVVRPGDKFKDSTGERSEVVLDTWKDVSKFKIWGDEGQEFYRISVKLDPAWQSPQANSFGYKWGTFFQAHGPDKYLAPPAISLHAEDKFGLFVLGGDLSRKTGGMRVLSKSHLNLGKWVDFILAVKWSALPDGEVVLYRRDEGQTTWEIVADIKSVATLQYLGSASDVAPHYWKAGFYRSESSHVNMLWLGPIVRAKTFAEAADSAWTAAARTSSSTSTSSSSSSSESSSASSDTGSSSSSSSSASAPPKTDSGSSSRSTAPAPRDGGSTGSSPKAVTY